MAKFLLILPILNLTTLEYPPSPQIEIWPGLDTLSFDQSRIHPQEIGVGVCGD